MMANNELKNPIKESKSELSARIKRLKVIYDWPKIDIDDDKQVEDRINQYFNYVAEAGIKPSVEGLALALGISRKTLWDWDNERRRAQVSSSRADIIKKAKDFIAFLINDAALDNKIYPATWIFYAKNYFGMTDKQEIEVKASNPLGNTLTAEEIAKQIPQDIPIDTDWTDE